MIEAGVGSVENAEAISPGLDVEIGLSLIHISGNAAHLKTSPSALYKGRNSLPDAASNSPSAPKPRRWSILAAGLLLIALALVVIYTSRSAFLSPLALVVVAAIGLAALLLELRLRKDLSIRCLLYTSRRIATASP